MLNRTQQKRIIKALRLATNQRKAKQELLSVKSLKAQFVRG